MNPEDERLLRKNWTFLKQELRVEDFIHRFVEHEIFTSSQRSEILNPLPNTHSMRCEKFLQAVVASGHRGFLAFCNFLKDNADNRYSRVIAILELNTRKLAHKAYCPYPLPRIPPCKCITHNVNSKVVVTITKTCLFKYIEKFTSKKRKLFK